MSRVIRVKTLLDRPEPTAEAFRKRWGPAALLHLPSAEQVNRALLTSGAAATALPVALHQQAQRILFMLRAFREMEVEFLPATDQGVLTLGRDPQAQLVVNDVSVSKQHATLRWSPRGYWVRDEGSRNGTFVNAARLEEERKLMDGETVGLGDAQLLFTTTPTLFLQLQSLPAADPARS